MRGQNLAPSTRFLVIALGLLYALAAVGGLALVEFENTRDIVLWTVFLAVGAALLLAGRFLVRPGALSVTVISVGAVVGGLPRRGRSLTLTTRTSVPASKRFASGT